MSVLGVIIQSKKVIVKQYKRNQKIDRSFYVDNNILCLFNISKELIIAALVSNNDIFAGYDILRKLNDILFKVIKIENISKRVAEIHSILDELVLLKEYQLHKQNLLFKPLPNNPTKSMKKPADLEIFNKFHHLNYEREKVTLVFTEKSEELKTKVNRIVDENFKSKIIISKATEFYFNIQTKSKKRDNLLFGLKMKSKQLTKKQAQVTKKDSRYNTPLKVTDKNLAYIGYGSGNVEEFINKKANIAIMEGAKENLQLKFNNIVPQLEKKPEFSSVSLEGKIIEDNIFTTFPTSPSKYKEQQIKPTAAGTSEAHQENNFRAPQEFLKTGQEGQLSYANQTGFSSNLAQIQSSNQTQDRTHQRQSSIDFGGIMTGQQTTNLLKLNAPSDISVFQKKPPPISEISLLDMEDFISGDFASDKGRNPSTTLNLQAFNRPNQSQPTNYGNFGTTTGGQMIDINSLIDLSEGLGSSSIPTKLQGISNLVQKGQQSEIIPNYNGGYEKNYSEYQQMSNNQQNQSIGYSQSSLAQQHPANFPNQKPQMSLMVTNDGKMNLNSLNFTTPNCIMQSKSAFSTNNIPAPIMQQQNFNMIANNINPYGNPVNPMPNVTPLKNPAQMNSLTNGDLIDLSEFSNNNNPSKNSNRDEFANSFTYSPFQMQSPLNLEERRGSLNQSNSSFSMKSPTGDLLDMDDYKMTKGVQYSTPGSQYSTPASQYNTPGSQYNTPGSQLKMTSNNPKLQQQSNSFEFKLLEKMLLSFENGKLTNLKVIGDLFVMGEMEEQEANYRISLTSIWGNENYLRKSVNIKEKSVFEQNSKDAYRLTLKKNKYNNKELSLISYQLNDKMFPYGKIPLLVVYKCSRVEATSTNDIELNIQFRVNQEVKSNLDLVEIEAVLHEETFIEDIRTTPTAYSFRNKIVFWKLKTLKSDSKGRVSVTLKNSNKSANDILQFITVRFKIYYLSLENMDATIIKETNGEVPCKKRCIVEYKIFPNKTG